MINRIALFIASLTAAAVLAFGLAATGLVPLGPSSTAGPVAVTDPPPQPTVQVDTVYLTPPVAPQDITVTRTVTSHGERDEGHEGGEND
jgi:hypothetical protein